LANVVAARLLTFFQLPNASRVLVRIDSLRESALFPTQ
jgi:hypothetical protein